MKRGNLLRRAGLLLALLVLAAIVTGVAASAATTVIPRELTGSWVRNDLVMGVSRRGKVRIDAIRVFNARFSRVTTQRLKISGVCSGTGTYRWTITYHLLHGGAWLKLKKIHDACKQRVELFAAGVWVEVHGT